MQFLKLNGCENIPVTKLLTFIRLLQPFINTFEVSLSLVYYCTHYILLRNAFKVIKENLVLTERGSLPIMPQL